MRRTCILLAAVLSLACAAPAWASLVAADLERVGARPNPAAAADLSLPFQDDLGRPLSLGQAIAGRPTALVFADYTCAHLCGPGLVLAAGALTQAGLAPDAYRLVVVGLDPKDRPAAAHAMRSRLHATPRVERDSRLLVGDAASVAALTRALGYRYVYDAQADQFAHDATLSILTPTGRLSAALPELALDPAALRTALTTAGRGGAPHLQASSLTETFRILCYGLDPAHGRYDGPVAAALKLGVVATLALMASGLALLARRRRGVAG